MSLEGYGTDSTVKNTIRYTSAAPKLHVEEKQESYPPLENPHADAKQQQGVDLPKKTAKIHDFCLGIPFGKCYSLDCGDHACCMALCWHFGQNNVSIYSFLFESCFLLSIVTNGQKKACADGV